MLITQGVNRVLTVCEQCYVHKVSTGC